MNNDTDVLTTLLGIIFGVVIVVIVMIPLVLLNGLVLSYMWGWFVVPKFELPILSVVDAILLGTLITFITYNGEVDSKKSTADKLTSISLKFVSPPITLGIFYIIMLFQ